MQERKISPEESLQIIQKMIDNSRLKASENGFHLMMWAIVISVASVLQYLSIMYRYHLEKSWLMWIAAVMIAMAIGYIYEFRRHKKTKIEKNKVNRNVDLVWMSFGVSAFLVWAAAYKYAMYNVTPFILICLGAATFVSGNLLEFKPLIRGGIIFWVACVICFIVNGPVSLLVNAVAMLAGFLVPGIILWKEYKAERNV